MLLARRSKPRCTQQLDKRPSMDGRLDDLDDNKPKRNERRATPTSTASN